ncbi:MAG: hypothetical protein JW850_20415 [Thermoflexales bacterium]|nr:hypothetical protein [Thermoflexales bacterium]
MKRSHLIFLTIVGSAMAIVILAALIQAAVSHMPQMIDLLRAPQDPPALKPVTATPPRQAAAPEVLPEELDGSSPAFPSQRAWLSLPGAEVRDVIALNSYNEAVTFVGEVINTGEQAIKSPRIYLLLYGSDNTKLDVVTGHTEHDLVRPGERVPFSAYLSETPPNWARFEIVFRPQAADGHEYSAYTDFEPLDDQLGPDKYSGQIVSGTVRNTGEKSARFVQAVVSLYNAEEKIIGLDTSYINGKDERMAPGQVLPFEVRVHNYSDEEIAFYRVQFVANVPE